MIKKAFTLLLAILLISVIASKTTYASSESNITGLEKVNASTYRVKTSDGLLPIGVMTDFVDEIRYGSFQNFKIELKNDDDIISLSLDESFNVSQFVNVSEVTFTLENHDDLAYYYVHFEDLTLPNSTTAHAQFRSELIEIEKFQNADVYIILDIFFSKIGQDHLLHLSSEIDALNYLWRDLPSLGGYGLSFQVSAAKDLEIYDQIKGSWISFETNKIRIVFTKIDLGLNDHGLMQIGTLASFYNEQGDEIILFDDGYKSSNYSFPRIRSFTTDFEPKPVNPNPVIPLPTQPQPLNPIDEATNWFEANLTIIVMVLSGGFVAWLLFKLLKKL